MLDRVRAMNDAPTRRNGKYVIYWAQMNRRTHSNHALSWAIQRANELSIPVLVYEGLTCTYRQANDRMHTFILEGVPETERRLSARGIGYCFYLRRRKSDANDVLYRLAEEAACVVTDDYPVFIAAEHNRSVSQKLDIAYEVVDSSCIVPMQLLAKREYAAYTIRPKINKMLTNHLVPCPEVKVKVKWSAPRPAFHTAVTAENIGELVQSCEIDHTVPRSISYRGGRPAAETMLSRFLAENLRRYAKQRNEPSAHATSELSPYLHFGMISSLEVALAVKAHAGEHKIIPDEFLEEMIVRRELAFNYARSVEQPDSLANLPEWARETLRKHAKDHREFTYRREEFEHAQTHDPLWNACQKEMLLRGKIHGYYRMYWGKKIIEWSATCQDALETMVHIHDRWALDGRDPNTYTNILWCFGLHDRPWGERPVFGMIRYMSYEGMKRKTNVDAYLREIAHVEQTQQDPFAVKAAI